MKNLPPQSERPRVGIDARLISGQNTGDSSYWTCLLNEFARESRGFEFVLYTLNPPPEPPGPVAHFSWRCLPARNPRIWSLLHFPRAASAECQIAHTQYSVSPLLKNAVTTVHDVSFKIGPEWFSVRDRFLLSRGLESASRRARAILTVSQTSRSEIIHHFPAAAGKTFVTPNAAPDWIIPGDPREMARVRERLGLPDRYLLTVGTDWARKNMQLAVAASRASGQMPLVITGKTDRGSESGIIRTGYLSQSELVAVYCGASLYLAPSLHEGFGIPLLEAFTCQIPVLCGRGGAMPEVAAGAAEIAPDYEISTWAALIQNLLADESKLQSLREKGKARASDFSWRATADLTAAVYRQLL